MTSEQKTTSNFQQVGEVQHLHELNDAWLQHLPIGTPLFTNARTGVGSDGLSNEDRAALQFTQEQAIAAMNVTQEKAQ